MNTIYGYVVKSRIDKTRPGDLCNSPRTFVNTTYPFEKHFTHFMAKSRPLTSRPARGFTVTPNMMPPTPSLGYRSSAAPEPVNCVRSHGYVEI